MIALGVALGILICWLGYLVQRRQRRQQWAAVSFSAASSPARGTSKQHTELAIDVTSESASPEPKERPFSLVARELPQSMTRASREWEGALTIPGALEPISDTRPLASSSSRGRLHEGDDAYMALALGGQARAADASSGGGTHVCTAGGRDGYSISTSSSAARLPETTMQMDDTFPPFAPPPPCRSRTSLLLPDPFLLDNIPLPPPKGDRNTLSKDHGRPSLDGSSSSTTCSQSSAVSIRSSRSVGWRPHSHRHDASKKRRRRLHAGDLYLVHTSTGAYPTQASPDSPSTLPGLLAVSSATQPWRYPRTKSVDARTSHGHAFSSAGPAISTQKATAGTMARAAAPGGASEPKWEQVGTQWIKRHQAKQQARQKMLQPQQTQQPAILAADAAHAVVGGGGAAAVDGPAPTVHLPAGSAPQHLSSRGRIRPSSAASTSRARVGVICGPAGGSGCAGGGAGPPSPAVCGLHDNVTHGQHSPTTSPTGEWDSDIRERSLSAPARMTLLKAPPESYESAKKWVQNIEASACESWWFQEMATPPESPTTRPPPWNQEAQFAETNHGDSGGMLSRSLSVPPARPSLEDIGIDGACAEGVGHELTAPPLASRLVRAASFGAQRVATCAGESARDAALASRSSACRTSLLSLSRSLGAVATPGSARRHSRNSKHDELASSSSAIAAESNTHRAVPCRVVDF